MLDGGGHPAAEEGARVGLIGAAADVLEAPDEGADHAVIVGGPATMLVAADSLFEPVHGGNPLNIAEGREGRKPGGRDPAECGASW